MKVAFYKKKNSISIIYIKQIDNEESMRSLKSSSESTIKLQSANKMRGKRISSIINELNTAVNTSSISTTPTTTNTNNSLIKPVLLNSAQPVINLAATPALNNKPNYSSTASTSSSSVNNKKQQQQHSNNKENQQCNNMPKSCKLYFFNKTK